MMFDEYYKENFEWNPVYNLVMKIQDEYVNSGYDKENYTFDLNIMIRKLNKPEYNEFLNNVSITNYGTYNLIKYILYNMDKTDMATNSNSIYRECRSVVIDMNRGEIVLCPFKKFFNINEIEETKINKVIERIKNAKEIEITNKLDGSMQSARYYHGEYIMSGSQALNPNNSDRLKEGYSWLDDRYKKMLKDYDNYSFVFEYISQNDLHVVRYKPEEQGLYLIGARDVMTGNELSYKKLKELSEIYNIPMTTIENKSFKEIYNELDGVYTGNEKEGWVLNIDNQKYKLKTNDFLGLQKIFHELDTPKVVLNMIKEDKFDDFISKVPEVFMNDVNKYADNIFDYIVIMTNTLMDIYYRLCDKFTFNNKKEFALIVNEKVPKDWRSFMFRLYEGKELNVLKNVSYDDIILYLEFNKKKGDY